MDSQLRFEIRVPFYLTVAAWFIISEITFWIVMSVLQGGSALNTLGRALMMNYVVIMGAMYARAVGRIKKRNRFIVAGVEMVVVIGLALWTSLMSTDRQPPTRGMVIGALVATCLVTGPMVWLYLFNPVHVKAVQLSKTKQPVG